MLPIRGRLALDSCKVAFAQLANVTTFAAQSAQSRRQHHPRDFDSIDGSESQSVCDARGYMEFGIPRVGLMGGQRNYDLAVNLQHLRLEERVQHGFSGVFSGRQVVGG